MGMVAQENLVSRSDRSFGRLPTVAPASPRSSETADIGGAAPALELPTPDCMAIIRRSRAHAGLSERAASLIAGSKRKPTLGVYNSHLTGFYESHSITRYKIAGFLIALFDKGRSISTIRGYRSALAVHIGGTSVSSPASLDNWLRARFYRDPLLGDYFHLGVSP